MIDDNSAKAQYQESLLAVSYLGMQDCPARRLSSENQISQLQSGAQCQKTHSKKPVLSLSLSNNRLGHSSLQITYTKKLMATKIRQIVFSYFLRPVQRNYWLQQQKLFNKTVFCRQLLKYGWPFPQVTSTKKWEKCCKTNEKIQEKERKCTMM